MQNDSTVFVGLDVHKESIVAACAVGYDEVQEVGEVGVREYEWERLCRRMQSKASKVVFVYEAGPCGYALQRFLTRKGYECKVCAPSLVARKPGDRVKTDRRDAAKLVKQLRNGDLAFVHVPDEREEAFRDLVRAWGAAKLFAQSARLEQMLREAVPSWRFYPVIEALQALLGVQFTVAVGLVAEVGDLSRFDNPRQLMAWFGLVPSQYSSGPACTRAASPSVATAMRVG